MLILIASLLSILAIYMADKGWTQIGKSVVLRLFTCSAYIASAFLYCLHYGVLRGIFVWLGAIALFAIVYISVLAVVKRNFKASH